MKEVPIEVVLKAKIKKVEESLNQLRKDFQELSNLVEQQQKLIEQLKKNL